MNTARAKAALDEVGQLRRAALSRSLPPRWLGMAIALILGASGAMAAGGLPSIYVLVTFLTVIPVILFGKRSLGAMARRSSFGFSPRLVAVQLLLVLLVVSAITLAESARVDGGVEWAPLAGGMVVALTIYAVFEYKRATYAASIAAGDGEE